MERHPPSITLAHPPPIVFTLYVDRQLLAPPAIVPSIDSLTFSLPPPIVARAAVVQLLQPPTIDE